MHDRTLDHCKHTHVFLGNQHDRNARRVWFVVAAVIVAR